VHSASGAVPAAGVFVGLEEGGFGAVDGEAGGARPLAPLIILEGESLREVLKGGTHVLDGVTDDDAQERRRFLAYLRPEDVLAAVRVRFVGNSVRLSGGERGKLITEHFQMLTRPVELEASTRERIGHGKR